MPLPPPDRPREKRRLPFAAALSDTFGWSPAVASGVTLLLFLALIGAVVWVIRTNPPRRITIASGPPGSTYHRWAERYQQALAPRGVTLVIRATGGSEENLDLLLDPKSGVDIGFVAGGVTAGRDLDRIRSLGSVAYQPMWVFCRTAKPISHLADLAGHRVAVGPPGSGTHALALTVLKANGITGPPTTFVELDSAAAAQALLDGKLDAAFMMGDSASIQTLRSLIRDPSVQMFNFAQADAYVRRLAYLSKMEFPEGSFDLGHNLPAQNVTLIGPTVELVAHANLNSALSDLLLEVAKDVHGRSNLLQKRGEFPAPIEHEITLSEDAIAYYKAGKGFLYRKLDSFWLASLLNRILVAVVPLVLVVVPAMRFLPTVYRFRIQLRFYRCYRPLLRIEREAFGGVSPERARELLAALDEIQHGVNHLKVPASFAAQCYELRSHIALIRERLRVAVTA